MMMLSREVQSLMSFEKWIPIGSRRFLMDLGDNGYIAEWLGWTDIDSPDGMLLRGFPPAAWIDKSSPVCRWGDSKIARIKKHGGSAHIPNYCHEAAEWYWVEREIEARKMVEYDRVLDIIFEMTDRVPCNVCGSTHLGIQRTHMAWNASTIGPVDKSAALLIALGHPVLTYDAEDVKRYPDLKFEVMKADPSWMSEWAKEVEKARAFTGCGGPYPKKTPEGTS